MASQNKKISFFYSLIIFGSFVAFGVTYYQKYRMPSDSELAEVGAELVGRNLISKKFEMKIYLPQKAEGQRGLASQEEEFVTVNQTRLSGEAGRDPWGRPFYYQVKGDGIKNSTLYIWSLGEDAKPSFRDFKDLVLQGTRGDDILVTMDF